MDEIIEKASQIPSWVERSEMEVLAGMVVPIDGLIVEIGALYGGATAVLALANPKARVVTIDEFSWTPPNHSKAGKAVLRANLDKLGIENVEIIEGDSRIVGIGWTEPIDLLFVDGGHDFQYVFTDLINFGPHASVIAVHDYNNPRSAASVNRAVDGFILAYPVWEIVKVVDTMAILGRKEI